MLTLHDNRKTATVLELAHQQADTQNIFFIHASDDASLHQAYLYIARRIGPEYLLKDFRGQDLQQIWRNESSEEKVGRFKSWLDDPENAETLFILDDMDGLKILEERAAALPNEAKNILYTTQNPVFRESSIRSRHKVRISTMDADKIIEVMEDVRNNERTAGEMTGDLHDRGTLLNIAAAVYGHPLAASIAIKYICRVISQYNAETAGMEFVIKFESDSFGERREFLDFTPEVPSIMETFYVSKSRLPEPDGAAWKLMQFHSMLETEGSASFDPRKFFFNHSCQITPEEFPDSDILGAENFYLRRLFSDLETVSFGERIEVSNPFSFHPLWLECTRHAMGSSGRLRYARQVLLVCYHSIFNQVGKASPRDIETRAKNFLPQALYCKKVCRNFRMPLEDLKPPEPVHQWMKYLDGASNP
jgi:hypothetical protein